MPWGDGAAGDQEDPEPMATSAAASAESPTPTTLPEQQPEQEQARRSVDILQHLPQDVVFLVEVFLPVPTLLGAF
jgi:hypothetical protein